jgi:hypothetical protein
VENAEWMNEDLRQEIEDLRQKYGLEQREAIAFWHLLEARQIMTDLTNEDYDRLRLLNEQEYEAEGLDEVESTGRVLGLNDYLAARFETTIGQPFRELLRALGVRVLRRQYPGGWGQEFSEEDE